MIFKIKFDSDTFVNLKNLRIIKTKYEGVDGDTPGISILPCNSSRTLLRKTVLTAGW